MVHEEMMSLLTGKKINSYSFTPKKMRKTVLIIRGMYYCTEAAKIKKPFLDIVLYTITEVSKCTITSSLKKQILHWFIFSVSNFRKRSR